MINKNANDKLNEKKMKKKFNKKKLKWSYLNTFYLSSKIKNELFVSKEYFYYWCMELVTKKEIFYLSVDSY